MKDDDKPRCSRCGRVLRSKESIHRGMGKACLGKTGTTKGKMPGSAGNPKDLKGE